MKDESEIRERLEKIRGKDPHSIYGNGYKDAGVELLEWVLEEDGHGKIGDN